MKNKRGLLIVLSGPSGCGKGTVVQKILADRPDTKLSVSATTRKPRPYETDGLEYSFISERAFEQMIAENGFLEYAVYNNTHYGTPKAAVEEKLAAGMNVILEIDVQGGRQIERIMPDAVTVFLMPPSMSELERRLRERATEGEEDIRSRLHLVAQELVSAADYRYLVVNDEVDKAAACIESIMDAEQARCDRMKDYIKEVISDAEADRY